MEQVKTPRPIERRRSGDDNVVALPQALVDPVYAGLTRSELAEAFCQEVQAMDVHQLARLSWAISAVTGRSTPLE